MRATAARWLLSAATLIIALAMLPTLAAAAANKRAAPEEAPLPAIEGPYVVVDAKSGRVIEQHDALRPWYPASTTKLMTIYVAFRAIEAGEISLETPVIYSANAAAEPPSKMGFRPGTRISLDNALKMMMVKSANDIAVAVAETVGGSVSRFSDRMNFEASRLGMTRSHFVNPHGLPDPAQYTSARDMALVARALLTDFPEYRDFLKLPAIKIGGRVLKNFNTLLERYPGATGMKTGFICASGYNLVASAKRGTRELIAVVFGESGGRARAERAAELLDAAFASPLPTVEGPDLTLSFITSGAAYREPLDMRFYVCGPRRVVVASEENDDGDEGDQAASHLSETPIYLGPPVTVSAAMPAVYGEPGFVARLPKPRPGEPSEPEALNAFAPVETGATGSAPTDAIGAAAGGPQPLNSVTSQ